MLNEIDLRELSEISDTKPSFVSVYLNAKSNEAEKFIIRRERECLNALSEEKELKQIFQKNMEEIR